jgi:hypothetical protein
MAKSAVKEHFDKPKKAKKEKVDKVTSIKTIGHNSGEVVEGLVAAVDEMLSIAEQKKALGKAERDIRNMVKDQYGVLSSVFAHEIRLRKLAKDARVQFESGHADLKIALGYQYEMDLKADTIARTEQEYVDPGNKVLPETLQREG